MKRFVWLLLLMMIGVKVWAADLVIDGVEQELRIIDSAVTTGHLVIIRSTDKLQLGDSGIDSGSIATGTPIYAESDPVYLADTGTIWSAINEKVPTNDATYTSTVALAASALQSETYVGTLTGATMAASNVDGVTITGPNQAFTWNTNAAIFLPMSPSNLVVTNGQTLTVIDHPVRAKYVVFGQGQVNLETNILTLAAPGRAGQEVTFMGGWIGNSNRVAFPTSGSSRGPATLHNGIATDDTCSFIAVDTSTWLCTGYDLDD